MVAICQLFHCLFIGQCRRRTLKLDGMVRKMGIFDVVAGFVETKQRMHCALQSCALTMHGILVPRGCDPFGQRHGSIHGAGQMDRSLWGRECNARQPPTVN